MVSTRLSALAVIPMLTLTISKAASNDQFQKLIDQARIALPMVCYSSSYTLEDSTHATARTTST